MCDRRWNCCIQKQTVVSSVLLTKALMPFKSQAQRRKFAQLLVEKKISPKTFEEWNRETGRKKLPERVAATSKGAKRAKSRRKR
jgi:hypothetical protein